MNPEMCVVVTVLLQSSQASCEHPVVHCASGLTEAHRLLSQVTVRRRQTRSVALLFCRYDTELIQMLL